tara:strand:+ start:454 stop:654 length:201 start_codon:yes stop_codon:yes gene_type:complete
MLINNSSKTKVEKKEVQEELNSKKKVDINILLNRVKVEKQNAVKKNFIITFGAIGTLAVTGLIVIL